MLMNFGYEHIIIGSYIIYIEKTTADLESKYRKYLSSICIQNKWDMLKGKTRNSEIFYLENKIIFVFYFSKKNMT